MPQLNLKSKKIVLGITGGIAAYKSAELTRLFKKAEIDVKIIMTNAAQEFITPLTLSTLSGNQVYTEMFQQNLDFKIEHIALARWAEMIIIAPATANFLAKLAHGFADDLLTTVCLASASPIIVAPAMNQAMWQKRITQNNIATLKQHGVHILEPSSGIQACGEEGAGRMLEPKEILASLNALFADNNHDDDNNNNPLRNLLDNRKIIITAGPTYEPIDSVRYLTNYSSGKMGYGIAEAAKEAGAKITLISGPTNLNITPSNNIQKINVLTAQEMHDAVMQNIKNCDIFISAAAISDYCPTKFQQHKIKRSKNSNAKISLELKQNPDILALVAALPKPPFTVGFAAETEDLEENAAKKLAAKKIDMIVANLVGFDKNTNQSIGFNNDINAITILSRDNKDKFRKKTPTKINLSPAPKTELARKLISIIAENYLK